MTKIAASILSADFSDLKSQILKVQSSGVDMIHIDVMDGMFVPNITVGPCVVESIRKITDLPLDVHLMIVEPERFIREFISAGADLISIHQEACTHLHRTITMIKENGIKAGIAINPATSLFTIEEILPVVDYVLIMSVNPGFGNQKFIELSYEKLKKLKNTLENLGLNKIKIEVDGGVKPENAAKLVKCGADILVAGSAIFTDRIEESVKMLKEAIGRI